jgi:hypothetical protein
MDKIRDPAGAERRRHMTQGLARHLSIGGCGACPPPRSPLARAAPISPWPAWMSVPLPRQVAPAVRATPAAVATASALSATAVCARCP